jgi:hypothetical protein
MQMLKKYASNSSLKSLCNQYNHFEFNQFNPRFQRKLKFDSRFIHFKIFAINRTNGIAVRDDFDGANE